MQIGFIGLGRMGGPMSRNLAKSGHTLFVFDVRREAADAAGAYGATPVANPAEAAERADAVVISVPGPQEDEHVMHGSDGVLAGARKGLLVIDMTTITVQQSRALGQACGKRGIDYLDAPVSGGPHGAAAGNLTVMVGGPAATYERALPILRCIGDNVRHIGEAGAGTAIKLINQAVYVAYMAAFGEGLALGESVGIPLETLLDVLGSSAAGHPMIATKYPEIRGDGASGLPGFAVDRGILFLDLAREAFRDSPYRTPLIDAAFASLRDAEKKGLARDDIIVARKRYLGNERAK